MNSFSKGKATRKYLFSLIGVLIVFLASTHIAYGFPGFSLNDITGGFVSTLSFYVSTVIAGIFGIVVAVEAWLLTIILNINDLIFQTVFVQSGFSVALSIANLAFVLGIIVIAIATIIRNESYGIKKLLWKLVVAAVLVNFGLVIAAPIFGLSNSFSHYFVNCISPTAGGCSGNSSLSATGESYENFATSFAGAFQPQDNFTTLNEEASKVENTTGAAQKGNDIAGAFSVLGTDFGKTAVPVVGMVFVVINLCLITIVLGGFIVLLLIRFIYISILAILMPFAWASWVFPAFGNHWKKWWSKFLQWTFFAPIAFFFIYLAMLLMQVSHGTAGAVGGIPIPSCNASGCTASGTIFSSLSGFFTGLFTPIIVAFVQEIVFAGLIVGGLFAANSMGIKGAGAVTGALTSAGNATKNWAAKRTKQAAGRMVPKNLKENLQSGKYRFAPKKVQVAAGLGLGNIERAGRGDMVAEESKYAEDLAKDPATMARVLASGGINKKKRMAVLAQLSKDEELQKKTIKAAGIGNLGELSVNGKSLNDFLRGNETEFKDLQQGGVYEKLKEKSGLSLEEASQKNKTAEETVLELGDKVKAQEYKDVYEKWSGGTSLSPSEKKVLDTFSARLDELVDLQKKNIATDSEKDELTRLQGIQNSKPGTPYISAGEHKRYDDAKVVFDENIDKIKKLIAKDPNLVAQAFKDPTKASNPALAKSIQESVFAAIAQGSSSQNIKELLKSIAASDNMKYFENASENMDPKILAGIQSLSHSNKELVSFIRNSPSRDLAELNEIFGIRHK